MGPGAGLAMGPGAGLALSLEAWWLEAVGVRAVGMGGAGVDGAGVGAWQVVDDDTSCTTPEQAFEQHFSMVWRSMRRLGVPESALDDAVQDVFLVLHRRWSDFQHQSSLSTWIYGILLRVASDHTRRARRERARWSPEVPELESSADSPDRLYQQREAALLLRLALEQLEDKERQMLVLIDLEERSVVEASEALGINLNTAYSRLRRARQSFEKALRAAQSKREARDPLEDSSPLTESNGE
jgi:RNA polymerase sigma-70 factor (ECF subfamily)